MLTLAAGLLIGYNRSERGHAAGLRTTTLVCLAASVSMIQMDMLLAVDGKGPSSFSVMDVMRLPLGILSGMGFIGAGAILRRGDIVTGVTTAATLWVVTVIGLCLGGGQLGLGITASLLVFAILRFLKRFDMMVKREHRANLIVTGELSALSRDELKEAMERDGITSSYAGGDYKAATDEMTLTFDVRWHARATADEPRELVDRIRRLPGVRSLKWEGVA
ncbi:MgtC/SapB family protein [Sphingomonas oryzagri]